MWRYSSWKSQKFTIVNRSIVNANNNISTTVHATTKSFVPFYSAQDGESTDNIMNCLVL